MNEIGLEHEFWIGFTLKESFGNLYIQTIYFDWKFHAYIKRRPVFCRFIFFKISFRTSNTLNIFFYFTSKKSRIYIETCSFNMNHWNERSKEENKNKLTKNEMTDLDTLKFEISCYCYTDAYWCVNNSWQSLPSVAKLCSFFTHSFNAKITSVLPHCYWCS